MPHRLLICIALWAIVFAAVLITQTPLSASSSEGHIVAASKNFMENRLLAEMFAQLIEARTSITVERRLGLAGTQVCFEALKTGSIDLYPEYTGTGLMTILGAEPIRNPREALNRVRSEFLAKWNIWWLAPLGFENSYALALPQALAHQRNLQTISDLVKAAPTMKAGLGYEFIQRADGLPGLQQTYGLHFGKVITMQQTLKYQAADSGAIDVLDVNTTDGRLAVYNFRVLTDDRQFFPPYDAAALVRGQTLEQFPQIGSVLALLTNALDQETMRGLNLRLQEQEASVPEVAHDALATLGLVGHSQSPSNARHPQHVLSYLWAHRHTLLLHTVEHISLAGLALGFGILIAVPLGLLLERQRPLAEPVIRMIGMTQTVPSIALLACMIPLFGVGALPAIMALWIYSIFPILRNTYSGLRDAAPATVEAARALGMTQWQILSWVRLPLAAPTIMAGIRTSAVLTVGTATLAAFIGAGGLGVPIVSGLQLADTTIILSGALPAAVLALIVDGGLGYIERRIQPKGLEIRRS